jgi:endonuclease-3
MELTDRPIATEGASPGDYPIEPMMDRIREAVLPYPKAALFELAEDGYNSAFEQLVACIISIRTRDETTLPTVRRLFARARTPAEIAGLSVEELETLIHASMFSFGKAPQIHEIARRVVEEYDGVLPCDLDVMLSFKGVGIKCAHLALGVACNQPRVAVDVHVHRITNRWGYVATATPEQTTAALEAVLPQKYWIEINRLLVPFGKHICTGALPHCSTCPVREWCRRVGVTKSR